MKGKFIVFEGIDGSGKSTQCSMLYDYIKSLDLPARLLAEPTSGEYGKKIRQILQGNIPVPVEEQVRLFIEDRQEDYLLNIKPCIDSNITIVMDRYFYSNAAYQGSPEISPEKIIRKNLDRGFPLPDRIYYIDIEPEIAMSRIAARNGSGKTELFEKKAFLEIARKNFLSMVNERILQINGALSTDKIFRIIKDDYHSLID